MPFDPLTQILPGTHSIEASAGTGKTYSITLIWLRLLVEHGLRVEEILVSTFTSAATAELKERLLAALRRSVEATQGLLSGKPAPDSGPEAAIVEAHIRGGGETAEALCMRLTEALSAFDLAPISTLHSFCQSLISRHSVELGCDSGLSLVEDMTRLLAPLVDDQLMQMADEPSLKHKHLRQVAETVTKNPAARLVTGSPDDTKTRMAEAIARDFGRVKLQAGVRGFHDILSTVYKALNAQGAEGALATAVRKRLKAAIIDECQDSDGVQIGVFDQLFYHKDTVSFIVIGDPKQSIYRFRCADLTSYKGLASRATAAEQMTHNHRSDGELINALNSLYGTKFVFPDSLNAGQDTEYTPVEAAAALSRIQDPGGLKAVVFQWSGSEKREIAKARLAEQVASECRRLLSAGVEIEDRFTKKPRPLRAGDIAVLANGHKELKLVRQKLTQHGIPNQSSGKGLGSVFASDEAADVLAWLELYAALEQRGNVLGKLLAYLGTPLGGWTPENFQALRTNAVQQATECSRFLAQLPQLSRQGPLPLLLKHIGTSDVIEANLASAEGERRYTNWRQLGALLQHEHGRGRRGARALALWLARMNSSVPTSTDDDPDAGESALMKLETDGSAIQLATIHSSKGLEYPIVFCPFLWDVRSVKMRKQHPVAVVRTANEWLLDVGSPAWKHHIERAVEQEKEEAHRKNYVAVTRARHRLYLGLAPVKDSKGGHENGVTNSTLCALEGLKLNTKPPAQWPLVLKDLPFCSFTSDADPAHMPAAQSFPQPIAGGALPLQKPPALAPYTASLTRTHSFSSLARTDHEHHSAADRDLEEAPKETAGTEEGVPNLLAELGDAGASLGDQLHSVLEEFLGNRRELREALGPGKPPETWERVINQILDTDLHLNGREGVTLRSLREGCITEMQFQLPVAHLSAERLSAALLQDPEIQSHEPSRYWAAGLSQWGFSDFAGYFQGFIDLIFEHEGRWFVADYKSNLLRDYRTDAIRQAMVDKNYLLQARLYALALHRHLQVHLEGYDFDTHFGGVTYLFMRGFPSQGIWFNRPSLEAIEALGKPFHYQAL
jgi:exodeoxyribonuclease V beta subunit